MPATSVRDLLIKDDDLAVATHGRGFWILDDITPLRQMDDKVTCGDAYLFAPELAYARSLEHQQRHAAAAGCAGRTESAGRRNPQLLLEVLLRQTR